MYSQGYEKMVSIRVERGAVMQIKGGAIHHDSLIGKEYGSRVALFVPFCLINFQPFLGANFQWEELGLTPTPNP